MSGFGENFYFATKQHLAQSQGLTQSQCGLILYESCLCCFMKGVTDSLIWVSDSWQDAILIPDKA